MHQVPNIAIGKVEHRHITRLMIPHLYRPGSSPAVPRGIIEFVYDKGLRPTVEELLRGQLTNWPVSYAAALTQYRGGRGRLHFSTIDIPAYCLNDFATLFLEKLSLHNDLRDAYFLHELRGTKGSSTHDPETQFSRSAALNDLTKFLDEDSLEPDNWQIDVALNVHVDGHVTHFLTAGCEKMLAHVLPGLTPAQVTKVTRNKRHYIDLAASLGDLGGFRNEPGSRGKRDDVTYINAYCTEKTAIYQLHDNGIFRRRTGRDLFPGKLKPLLDDLLKIGNVFNQCSQEDGLDANARFEIRMTMSRCLDQHFTYPDRLVEQTIVAIPQAVWW
jgi:hypothetical protein